MDIIRPEKYVFPGDEAAMEAVNKVPGLSKVLSFISKNSLEKMSSIMYSASLLQITESTAPKIYGFYREAAEAFGLDKMPEIYLQRDYNYETVVMGIENPIIIINSALLDDMSEDMLRVFLSSDIAGIQAGHGKLNFILWILRMFGNMLPIPKEILLAPLLQWTKQKYYTYDRARMIYCDDFDLVTKLIGYGEAPADIMDKLTLDERIEQGREFMEISGMQSIIKTTITLSELKPWNSMRLIELSNWVESGMYRVTMEENL